MRQTLLTRPNVEQLIKMTDLDLRVDGPIEREQLIEALPRQIGVTAVGKNLFKVSYDSTDARQSYRVVDSVLQIFVEQNVGSTQRDDELRRVWQRRDDAVAHRPGRNRAPGVVRYGRGRS